MVAVLNDLFGIQARGGCSCAGPYGHRLLAIGAARSHALREEIGHGCEGIKPGWTRVTFSYVSSASYIADAVGLVAGEGYRLLPDYRFDPRTGLWRHASGTPGALLRFPDVSYNPDGEMTYPRRRAQAGEYAFPGYLREARACWPPGLPLSPPGRRDSARTSRPCAGSRSRQCASGRSQPATWLMRQLTRRLGPARRGTSGAWGSRESAAPAKRSRTYTPMGILVTEGAQPDAERILQRGSRA